MNQSLRALDFCSRRFFRINNSGVIIPGGGGGALIFSYIRRLGPFFFFLGGGGGGGLKILISIFLGFSEKINIIWSMKILWIFFGVITKLDNIKRSFLGILGSFS